MDETMKLVIGWVIVAAFAFTTVATCMSLVGWIQFAHKRQQQGLYATLILELVVGTAAHATGNATVDAGEVAETLRTEGAADQMIETVEQGLPLWNKEQLEVLVERIPVKSGTDRARQKDELRREVARLPAGGLSTEASERIRASSILQAGTRFRPELLDRAR